MDPAATNRPSRSASSAVANRKEIKDFLIGKVLGEGAFARVYHVRMKETGQDYAMKIMEKQFILKHKKTNEVQMERRVFSEVSHPNIVRLHFSFHDRDRLYMVLDLCPYGELGRLIRYRKSHQPSGGGDQPCLSESETRFYLAETAAAVFHLHSLGIVHRDLKPENLLLDAAGHVKLTDFGTAKDMKAAAANSASKKEGGAADGDSPKRKDTFCGTAEYVSPEVLRDGVASYGADIWALGILCYACLVGKTPFLGESEYLTFRRILHYAGKNQETKSDAGEEEAGELADEAVLTKEELTTPETLAFPFTLPTDSALDLVKRLLNPAPEKRLGAGAREDFANHRFFAGINKLDEVVKSKAPELPKHITDVKLPPPSLEGGGTEWLVSEDGGDDLLSEFAPASPVVGGGGAGSSTPPSSSSSSSRRGGNGSGSAKGAAASLNQNNNSPPPRSPGRAMGSGSSSSSLPPPPKTRPSSSSASSRQSKSSSSQGPLTLDQFLKAGEEVVLEGPVVMRGGFVTRRRHLILTNAPRLFYIDPSTNAIKEQIQITPGRKISVNLGKNGRDFDVIVETVQSGAKRNYYFKDVMGSPQRWKTFLEGL